MSPGVDRGCVTHFACDCLQKELGELRERNESIHHEMHILMKGLKYAREDLNHQIEIAENWKKSCLVETDEASIARVKLGLAMTALKEIFERIQGITLSEPIYMIIDQAFKEIESVK